MKPKCASRHIHITYTANHQISEAQLLPLYLIPIDRYCCCYSQLSSISKMGRGNGYFEKTSHHQETEREKNEIHIHKYPKCVGYIENINCDWGAMRPDPAFPLHSIFDVLHRLSQNARLFVFLALFLSSSSWFLAICLLALLMLVSSNHFHIYTKLCRFETFVISPFLHVDNVIFTIRIHLCVCD